MTDLWWVASGNPVKLRAVELALARFDATKAYEVRGLKIPSGVAAQPMGETETRRGAKQRVQAAQKRQPVGAGWVGLEGGVMEWEGTLYGMAWAAVAAELQGRVALHLARSASFPLPLEIAERVRAGAELGEADDAVFGTTLSKQGGGAVGLLSGGALERDELYATAVFLALLPFRNPELSW
ncbi:MAG: inosine/xanthosine triphosphatase [Chloroflexi bacterium]|nr:inosine/xanthosine triphosphatase [Chloroflexota bacterium]